MEYYIGQVALFAFGYAPEGWALCDGQILNIQQNQALFALIGTTFGGNGSTTFGLPNLNGANGAASAAPNTGNYMKYYICTQGLFPMRQ